MTRDDAVEMVQQYLKSFGLKSPGLNEHNFGGATIGETEIYFEYVTGDGTLKCSALIYKFQVEPLPGILERFRDEELTTDAGGGKVDFEPENRGLFLSRTYTSPVSTGQLRDELQKLLQASRVWREEVLDRVASKTFHPEEISTS